MTSPIILKSPFGTILNANGENPARAVIVTEPGEEAQVDYATKKPFADWVAVFVSWCSTICAREC